ncbi:MAG: NUDIX domain-containing protein [Solobacterium sp.]|nr:NUDIX domain-containing protein [Solobacterium sp.]
MSNYIMDLRKQVGHQALLQCAGSIIIEDSEGRILLGKRTDNHKWGYAGGSIELGETVEECARRELTEETGLHAEELTFFMINSGEKTHYIYPNGDEVYNVEIVYLCRNWHGTLTPQESEIEELRFFSIDELPEISDPIVPVVNAYVAMRQGAK